MRARARRFSSPLVNTESKATGTYIRSHGVLGNEFQLHFLSSREQKVRHARAVTPIQVEPGSIHGTVDMRLSSGGGSQSYLRLQCVTTRTATHGRRVCKMNVLQTRVHARGLW